MILEAFREAGRALDDGELVCIFPEGQITRTGMTLPFQRGLERIVKGRDVPIIPVHSTGRPPASSARCGGAGCRSGSRCR